MKTRQQYIEIIKSEAPVLKRDYGVRSMSMFGSIAREDNNDDSDVDILVDMSPKLSALAGLHRYLELLLGRAVDLVRKHPNMNQQLLKEIERDGILII